MECACLLTLLIRTSGMPMMRKHKIWLVWTLTVHLVHISECDTALDAWMSLKFRYEDSILLNVISLRHRLYHKLKGISKPVDLELAMIVLVSQPITSEILVTSFESISAEQLTLMLVWECVLCENPKANHNTWISRCMGEKALVHVGMPKTMAAWLSRNVKGMNRGAQHYRF